MAQKVIDTDSTLASNSNYYYQNNGQIIDDTGGLRPDILYYTERTSPALYLASNAVSFVAVKKSDDTAVADSTFRLDMQFWCLEAETGGNCGVIQTYEPSTDHLNYYLPHCGSGITNVGGFGGIEYQNAFPNIDVHLYSNDMGLKTYFVFNPGADTSDFKLKFSGQDSIAIISGGLDVYVGTNSFAFPNAVAYEITSSGAIVPLSWTPTWVDHHNGIVSLNYGPYNPTNTLVIRTSRQTKTTNAAGNLHWCTYYGGVGNEANPQYVNDGLPKIATNSGGNLLFHVMNTSDQKLPHIGTSTFQFGNNGDYDCYITAFDNSMNRKWATYYGGKNYEEPTALETIEEQTTDFGDLMLAGRTSSTDLNIGTKTPGYQKATYSPSSTSLNNFTAFFASFEQSTGQLVYATYYGCPSWTYITDMYYNGATKEINWCGYVRKSYWNIPWSSLVDQTSDYPTSEVLSLRPGSGSKYFQNSDPDDQSALVGRFRESDRALVWATMLGGNWTDYSTKIVPDKLSGSTGFYVLGNTKSLNTSSTSFPSPRTSSPSSGDLPLSNPGSGSGTSAYFQSTGPATSTSDLYGMIFHFNSSDQIDWGTYLGAAGGDEFTGADVNLNGELYVVGSATSNNPSTTGIPQANTSRLLPVYNNGTSYSQGPANTSITTGNTNTDAVIAEFLSSHNLDWCTYFGQAGKEVNPSKIAIDNHNNVFIAGNTITPAKSATENIPIISVNGRYNQINNGSVGNSHDAGSHAEDGWLAQFSSSNNLVWSTHYGAFGTNSLLTNYSQPDEAVADICVGNNVSGTRLFMTGVTKSNFTPMTNPCPTGAWCDPSYHGNWDCFIGMFSNASATKVPSVYNNTSGNIFVSPNPSSGKFDINYVNNQNAAKTGEIIVVDALGQNVYTTTLSLTHGQNAFQLNLTDLSSGLYLLRISVSGKSETTRLSKL